MNRDPIIKGTLVLSGAMLVNRILGAIYRIPLSRLIGAEGLGLYQLVYPIYDIIAIFAIGGIPLATSKLIAEDMANNNSRGILRIFRVSLGLLFLTGTAGSLLLYIGAEFFANNLIREPRTYYAMVSIAPGILFMALDSAFHSFFRGISKMTPSALSGIVEQMARIVTMLSLGYAFMAKGIEYAAAGIALGTVSGGIAGIMSFIWLYSRERKEIKVHNTRKSDSLSILLYKLFSMAIPLVLGSLIHPITHSINAMLIPARLRNAGVGPTEIIKVYGEMTGMAMPFIYFPTIITGALATNLMPAIAGASAINDMAKVRRRTRQALRIVSLIGFPVSTVLFLLSNELCQVLFAASSAGTILKYLAMGSFFICLIQITGAILHGLGDTLSPVKHRLISSSTKIALIYILGGMPGLGIKGVAIAYTAGLAITGSLNLIKLLTRVRPGIDVNAFIIKPGSATLGTALFIRPIYLWVSTGTNMLLGILISIIVASFIYLLLLIILGGIKRRDILLIPRIGQKTARFLESLGLL